MTNDVKKHPHIYRSNGKINAKNFGNSDGIGAAWVTTGDIGTVKCTGEPVKSFSVHDFSLKASKL